MPDDDGLDGDVEVIDESRVPVSRVLKAEGEAMVYVYDFGDNWRHQVVFGQIVPVDAPTNRGCPGGERRYPPEDVGGRQPIRKFWQSPSSRNMRDSAISVDGRVGNSLLRNSI